jgi:hypothetical protein
MIEGEKEEKGERERERERVRKEERERKQNNVVEQLHFHFKKMRRFRGARRAAIHNILGGGNII